MKISVIIPVYNGAKTLISCLDSVIACQDPDFELIVVDDCSNDSTREILNNYPVVRTLCLSERSGAGEARKRGLAEATGELIAFTDSDCIVPPDWLATIRANITSEVGGIGGHYRAWKGQNFMGRFATHDLYNFWFSQLPEYCDHLATGNCAYWKKVLVGIDQKDVTEVFKGMAAAEDTLLGLVVSRQYKLRYIPGLYIYHLSPDRPSVYFRQQQVRGYSRIIVSWMHFRDKVMNTRDISVLGVALQLIITCGIMGSILWFGFNPRQGSALLGISLLAFILIQMRGLIHIYQEEKSLVFLIKSLPMIFLRNLAWWLGCMKGCWQILKKIKG